MEKDRTGGKEETAGSQLGDGRTSKKSALRIVGRLPSFVIHSKEIFQSAEIIRKIITAGKHDWLPTTLVMNFQIPLGTVTRWNHIFSLPFAQVQDPEPGNKCIPCKRPFHRRISRLTLVGRNNSQQNLVALDREDPGLIAPKLTADGTFQASQILQPGIESLYLLVSLGKIVNYGISA